MGDLSAPSNPCSASNVVSATAPKPVVLKCHAFLSTVPPPGSPAVDQPPSKGAHYGPVRCNRLGSGVMQDLFKVPDSGDTVSARKAEATLNLRVQPIEVGTKATLVNGGQGFSDGGSRRQCEALGLSPSPP